MNPYLAAGGLVGAALLFATKGNARGPLVQVGGETIDLGPAVNETSTPPIDYTSNATKEQRELLAWRVSDATYNIGELTRELDRDMTEEQRTALTVELANEQARLEENRNALAALT